jgi:hypothetical protein
MMTCRPIEFGAFFLWFNWRKLFDWCRSAVVIQQVDVIELLVDETVEIIFRVHTANLVFDK